VRDRLLGLAATLLACALACGVFLQAAPLAALIGLGELHLVLRIGLTFIALGLFDALPTRLFARIRPHS